jgi:hypothetical protein
MACPLNCQVEDLLIKAKSQGRERESKGKSVLSTAEDATLPTNDWTSSRQYNPDWGIDSFLFGLTNETWTECY